MKEKKKIFANKKREKYQLMILLFFWFQLLKQNSEVKNNLQTVFEKKKKINDWFALLLNF